MAECDKILDEKEGKVMRRRTTNTRPTSSGISPKRRKRSSRTGERSVFPLHAEGLTDTNLLELSKRITSEQELLELGINVLKIPDYEVDAALYNNKTEIQLAAHKVLTTWMKSQTDGSQAYLTLHTALRECEMNFLATQLKQWVEGTVGKSGISPERTKDIQGWLKESIRKKPFVLINTQDWSDKPYKVDLRELFTPMSWKKKHRKAHGVQKSQLEDITVLLSEEQLGTEGPISILILGPGGIGKSTALKHLAVCWADGSGEHLKRFDFIFHIDLKHVKDNSPIEDIIISQHSGLEGNDVNPAEIKSILKGTKSTILILFDGHDEYKRGVNSDIDKTIERERFRNCSVIVTSRDTKQMKDIKYCMDAEAEINGFNYQNIKHYVTKSLGSKKKAKEFLEQAMERGLIEDEDDASKILAIPLFLIMTCTLFKSNIKFRNTRSGIFQAIVNRIIERERKRNSGRITLHNVDELIIKLGKLAWDGLTNSEGQNQVFTREEIIEAVGEEVFLLGLLIPAEEKPGQETDNFCFQHLLFQQFFAAKYVAAPDKDSLEKLFPSQYKVRDHLDVLLFACGLTDQPDVLVELICDTFATFCSQIGFRVNEDDVQYESGGNIADEFLQKFTYQKKTFESLIREFDPAHRPSINLLCNKYINIVTKDQTTVCVPSRFYAFLDVSDSSSIKYLEDEFALSNSNEAIAECAIIAKNETDLTEILNVIKKIKGRILATHLLLDCTESVLRRTFGNNYESLRNDGGRDDTSNVTKLTIESLEFSKDAKIILICDMQLSNSELSHLGQQLLGCQDLELLYLEGLNLPLSDKVSSMCFLGGFIFNFCKIEHDEYRKLAQNLQVCDRLEILNLIRATGVPDELGEAVTKMTSLRELNLQYCDMSLSVSAAVLKSLSSCPDLKYLYLDGNTLTGCMVHLLGDGHRGFDQLDHLDLREAELTQDDLTNVGNALSSGKLPVLKWLVLSENTLTNCVSSLLNPDDHSTVLPLEALDMKRSELSKSDLTCLSQVVKTGKLPNLKYLFLNANNLGSVKEVVKTLILSCVDHYKQQKLEIDLRSNDLSDELKEEMKSLCKGTNVKLEL